MSKVTQVKNYRLLRIILSGRVHWYIARFVWHNLTEPRHQRREVHRCTRALRVIEVDELRLLITARRIH